MTDPTPEERAASIDLGAPAEREVDGVRQWVEDEIRAAEAAMQEKCAEACEQIGKEIVCPEECAAAIRAQPEKSDGG